LIQLRQDNLEELLLDKIKWIIFFAVTVGFLAILIVFSGNTSIDVSKVNTNIVQIASTQNGNIADHIFGKTGSKVTLIEYADFQCPGCASMNPIIMKLATKYKDQLQFVFRNFPLTTIHPNAKAAAAATEAAGLQGKFWEMHTKIYETQSSWENLSGDSRTDFFAQLATNLGLKTSQFKTDMASSRVDAKINFDQAMGFKIKIDSTPTFYLDGTIVDSSVWSDNTKFTNTINAALTKAGIALPN
jgi:protein-disulfide isomerase